MKNSEKVAPNTLAMSSYGDESIVSKIKVMETDGGTTHVKIITTEDIM